MSSSRTKTVKEVKTTARFVEKDDGISISRVIFPNKLQVGLKDHDFHSDLVVKGDIVASGTIRGASPVVFADSIVVSGSITGNSLIIGSGDPGGTISGSIHHTNEGKSYLVAGTNITITSASNGQVAISSSGGGGGGGVTTGSFNVKYPAGRPSTFVTTSSVAITGPLGGFNNDISTYGQDMYFYVSGAVGSKGTTTQGLASFGGDMMISGALHVTTGVLPGSSPSDGQVIAWDNTNKRLMWKTILLGFGFVTSLTSFNQAHNAKSISVFDSFDPRTTAPLASGTISNS